jgi:hypothetical protein
MIVLNMTMYIIVINHAVLCNKDNCQDICHCLNGTSCNNIDGQCVLGSCDRGWRSDSCSERKLSFTVIHLLYLNKSRHTTLHFA